MAQGDRFQTVRDIIIDQSPLVGFVEAGETCVSVLVVEGGHGADLFIKGVGGMAVPEKAITPAAGGKLAMEDGMALVVEQ